MRKCTKERWKRWLLKVEAAELRLAYHRSQSRRINVAQGLGERFLSNVMHAFDATRL